MMKEEHKTREQLIEELAEMRRQQNVRPTIGYLAPTMHGSSNQAQWSGVVDAAQKHNVNLICFPGWSLHDPRGFQAQANVLYDLVGAENVDGVVSWASSLGNYAEADEIRIFHEHYRPLPMISIGRTLEGIPSLLMDSYRGMCEAVVHLIEAHGCRRLAFIRGPEDHFYAQERYRAYTEVLGAYGIPLDSNLVTPPFDWARSTGIEVMRLLLDERKLRPQTDFEAIVSANDDLLLGALEVLRARGIRVPGDVAIAGFNDTVQGRTNTPPLTSVAVPFYEVGYRAVETLLALMAGEQVPEEVILPSKLVVRQSCGCLDPAVVQAAAGPVVATGETFEAALALQREGILSEMLQAVGASEGASEWAGRLLDAFTAEIGDKSPGTFLSTLDETLYQVVAEGGDVVAWQKVLSALRRHTLPCLGDNEALSRAEDLWQQARVMIGEVAQRAQAYRRLREEQRAETLREISQVLITTFDVAGLMDILARELPRLGIPSCYLSLYQDPKASVEWSRLMLTYDENGRIELEAGGLGFPFRQLAPEGMLPRDRRYTMVVEPLYFQEDQLGVALFEVGPREGTIYEALRGEISSALQGALLLRERKAAEEALKEYSERLEEMVEERSQELREAQETLIRQEKLAVLGQLAGGVGHELRNPLGAIKNATYFLNMVLEDPEPEVKETLEILDKEVAMSESVISSLLDFARTKPPAWRKVDINEVVQEALSRAAVPEKIEVVSQLDEGLPIMLADPDQLGQVFGNIILNAVQAMSEGGRLVVKSEAPTPEWVAVSFTDTGVGIPEGDLEKLFEPLFTTKAKGIGLGLAVTKTLVEGHGGTIEVKSPSTVLRTGPSTGLRTGEVGVGTTFTVRLPISRS